MYDLKKTVMLCCSTEWLIGLNVFKRERQLLGFFRVPLTYDQVSPTSCLITHLGTIDKRPSMEDLTLNAFGK